MSFIPYRFTWEEFGFMFTMSIYVHGEHRLSASKISIASHGKGPGIPWFWRGEDKTKRYISFGVSFLDYSFFATSPFTYFDDYKLVKSLCNVLLVLWFSLVMWMNAENTHFDDYKLVKPLCNVLLVLWFSLVVWMNGEKRQLHFGTCLGKTPCHLREEPEWVLYIP
jgi:hypothetical protein